MIRRAGIDPASTQNTLTSEVLLIGAVLRQAVVDARGDQPSQCPERAQMEAQAFLLDQDVIDWWAALLGADGAAIGHALRREAGLEM